MNQPLTQLVDAFGRVHSSLRISVTDRCNIRCFYCMPAEQVKFLPRPEILTLEEIHQVAEIFASLGVRKIRLTGGEPLVRRQLNRLVEKLATIPEIDQLAMTTNALLLAQHAANLKQAGLDRINISLDTLDKQQFNTITRRDGLEQVFEGIREAQRVGFTDIRINSVAVRGLIESQIVPLVQFALDNNLQLRFIEFMPLNSSGKWSQADLLSGQQIKQKLETHFGPMDPVQREDPSQPATDFEFAKRTGRIGFINSVTEPFCGSCNRLRLTAEGKIRNCLFSDNEWDLRGMLRDGSSNLQIAAKINECVQNKHKAHGIGTPEFKKPRRAMHQIGG